MEAQLAGSPGRGATAWARISLGEKGAPPLFSGGGGGGKKKNFSPGPPPPQKKKKARAPGTLRRRVWSTARALAASSISTRWGALLALQGGRGVEQRKAMV